MSSLLPSTQEEALYIVDLHCWLHRFFRTMQGRCAVGFVEMLGKIIRQQQPSHMAICTDLPFPTFRNDLAPRKGRDGYKAHREPPDPTLLERLRWAREMAEDVHKIPVFSKRGFEADDIIATLHAQARAAGMKVVIVGLDKDLLQLVDDMTVMWDGKSAVVGKPEVIEKFGVRADQLFDYLCIVGDSADNIPGVAGMGPKAAVELLECFGTLENALLAANGTFKFWQEAYERTRPRHRELLLAAEPTLDLTRKLVRLVADVPLKHTLEDCRRHDD